MNLALIIENRKIKNLKKIISDHAKFLPIREWRIDHRKDEINSIEDYNKLLTSPEFWKPLCEYNKVLIFQHDSMLLRKGIEEFMDFDFVGAPFPFQTHGGNGGLSLRNPRVMRKICTDIPYDSFAHGNEDVYFSNIMYEQKHYGKLAPRVVCREFACETIFGLGSLGVHAIEKYLTKGQVKEIMNQYK